MKTKNVALAIIAFAFAIGGAFAYNFINNKNIFVRARLGTTPGGALACVDTKVQCDADGTIACQVQVPTRINNGTQLANSFASGTSFITYESGCTTVLKSTSSVVHVGTPDVTIYTLTTEEP
jgi:hypothetical protein